MNEGRAWHLHPQEPHIQALREDMSRAARTWEDWFSDRYSPCEIAYMVEKGLVSVWPTEFTARGRKWYRAGGIPPPARNVFWQPKEQSCSGNSASTSSARP